MGSFFDIHLFSLHTTSFQNDANKDNRRCGRLPSQAGSDAVSVRSLRMPKWRRSYAPLDLLMVAPWDHLVPRDKSHLTRVEGGNDA